MRHARWWLLVIGLLACDGSDEGGERAPVGPPAAGRTVVVRLRSVFPGEALCGSVALAGDGGFACAGDSLAVRNVPETAELVVEDPSLVTYVEPVVLGQGVTAWLLGRGRADVLAYVQEIVNASGARPFPFGFRETSVAVDLGGLSSPQAAVAREVVQRVDASLQPVLRADYFELVEERRDRVMNRLAPAEYWTASNGLNDFDSGVFALAVLTSENEIDLTNFR